jgi:hypothetical protein
MSVQELYEFSVRALTPAERLRLAKMILNELPSACLADHSEEWTQEDTADFSRGSL